MKRITWLVSATLLLLLGTTAFAQARTSLNIVSNERAAQVFINGRVAGTTNPNFSILLAPGSYDVSVQKQGFQPFVTKVELRTTPLTLNVTLVPVGSAVTPPPVQNQNVSINANVANAEVYLNNILAGRTPFNTQLPNGSYTLAVKAPGYVDFNQNLSVNGPTTVNAVLQPILTTLNLGRLMNGAEVFLNGQSFGKAGANPFSVQVAPGTYTLTIRLAGFMDLNMQVTVGAGGATLNPVLQPLAANYRFEIPANVLNPEMKGNPWSQIRLFIDDAAQKDFQGQVQPGKRKIRIVTGAFQIETEFTFEAGKSYVFQPFAGLNVLQ